jgi:dihydrofolate reductase
MSNVVLYMSMSLDGFVAGPNQSVENGLGDGGERLHDWIFNGGAVPAELREMSAGLQGANQRVVAELMSTGAVVTGRGTFEAAGAWGGDHHDGVPIFVLRRSAPEPEWTGFPLVTYVDGVVAAVDSARRAAGDRNVLMHGITAARLALEAGVLDELEIHVVPVLLGAGERLFDGLPPHQIELERMRTLEGDGGMVHLRYRVVRA